MSRFLTGHEVFDEIVQIDYGSSILILDESFMEARNLLNSLLKDKSHLEITSQKIETKNGQIFAIGDLSPSDASVKINKVRSDNKGSILIHDYIPNFLIKGEPDSFLRLLTSWRDKIKDSQTIEFFLLPKDAFREVERKIMSIMDGVVEIKVNREGRTFTLSFTVMRCCKPEWHLQEFRYKIEKSQVLIEWEGKYTDKLPSITSDEIKNQVEKYKQNLQFLKIERGIGPPIGLPIDEYWLLSYVENKDLYSIMTHFYENFDEILTKIAKWHLLGFLKVVKKDDERFDEIKFNIGKRVSLKTKLALKLPMQFTKFYLDRKNLHSVPADIYIAEKKAIYELLKVFFGGETEIGKETLDHLLSLEEGFHELVGRTTSVERIRGLGEDLGVQLDLNLLKKIVKITLHIGYKLDCEIKELSSRKFLITIPDCFLCEGIVSSKAVCGAITGALSGACSIAFKKVIKCNEIECKATGDENCIFELKIL